MMYVGVFLFRDIKLFKYRFDWFISIFECKDLVPMVIELRLRLTYNILLRLIISFMDLLYGKSLNI